MKHLLVFTSLVISTTVAHAQPEETVEQHGWFAFGGTLGVQRAVQLGGVLEAIVPTKTVPLSVHAQLAAGDSGLSAEGGSFFQLRGGVELGTCLDDELGCVFIGADLGYQNDHAVSQEYFIAGEIMDETADELLVVPRLGVETGKNAVKLRSAMEILVRTRIDGERGTAVGLAGTLAVAIGF